MHTAAQHSSDHAIRSTLVSVGGVLPTAQARPRIARWFALGAVASPVLFTLVWLTLGFPSPGSTAWGIRFAPYSPIVQPISGLDLGITAPFMNAAVILFGILLLIGVVGIFLTMRQMSVSARWIRPALFALSAIGAAMDGIFTLRSFLLHVLDCGLALGTPVLSFLVAGMLFRRVPTWRRFGSWLLLLTLHGGSSPRGARFIPPANARTPRRRCGERQRDHL